MKSPHPDILGEEEVDPTAPLIRRTNVDPNNPNVIIQGPFYRVSNDMSRVPLVDYLDHGYETREDFRDAIIKLVSRWENREGECVEERIFHGKEGEAIDQRHRQLHLRFHDTPGGSPDDAWLPLYVLDPIPIPDYARWHDLTPEEELLEEIKRELWEGD